MARTIKDIQQGMIDDLRAERPDLSPSAASEWRLWTWVVAASIHLFEVILDEFRSEVNSAADKIIPGTIRWYAEQCRRFQNGHELLFDGQTAKLYYAQDDPSSRIISVVAVSEGTDSLSIRVAKRDTQNRIVPLTSDELRNFTGYVDSIKFAGTQIITVSTNADRVRYDVEAVYDPAVPATTVRERITEAIEKFRDRQDFDSILYRQRFLAAVMAADGVVTAELHSLQRKGTSMTDFSPVGVADELEAGYFDYDTDSVLTLTSAKAL